MLWQTAAANPTRERGMVVVISDAGVQAHTFDDLSRDEFVEVRHAHRQVGICKQFDRLDLGAADQQHGDIPSKRTFSEQAGSALVLVATLAHCNTLRIQIVV